LAKAQKPPQFAGWSGSEKVTRKFRELFSGSHHRY